MLIDDGSTRECHLRINDHRHVLHVTEELRTNYRPPRSESADAADELKQLVSNIYAQLHIDEHQLGVEQKIVKELEEARKELMPLEQVLRSKLNYKC